jgi:vacuolar-type H+-ATPase subunit E/Vma4
LFETARIKVIQAQAELARVYNDALEPALKELAKARKELEQLFRNRIDQQKKEKETSN